MKESTLYSWANSGAIPAYKINGIWRFDMEEIEAWVKKGKSISGPAQRMPAGKADHRDVDNVVRKALDGVKGR